MSEPFDEWPCNLKISAEIKMSQKGFGELLNGAPNGGKDRENEFTFPCDSMCDDDDEVTESKIRAFLDEKVCLQEFLCNLFTLLFFVHIYN